MDYLVEFLEEGARLIKDPVLIEKKKNLPNILLNPNIKHLKGISPSFWYREGDRVRYRSFVESKKLVEESLPIEHSFKTANDEKTPEEELLLGKIESVRDSLNELSNSFDSVQREVHSKLFKVESNVDSKLGEFGLSIDKVKTYVQETSDKQAFSLKMVIEDNSESHKRMFTDLVVLKSKLEEHDKVNAQHLNKIRSLNTELDNFKSEVHEKYMNMVMELQDLEHDFKYKLKLYRNVGFFCLLGLFLLKFL